MSLSVESVISLYSNSVVRAWNEKSQRVVTLERSEAEKAAHEYASLLVKSGMSASDALTSAESIFETALTTDYDIRKMELLEIDTQEFTRKIKKHPELARRENGLFLGDVTREADLAVKAGRGRLFFCPASKLILVEQFAGKAGLSVVNSDREGFYLFV